MKKLKKDHKRLIILIIVIIILVVIVHFVQRFVFTQVLTYFYFSNFFHAGEQERVNELNTLLTESESFEKCKIYSLELKEYSLCHSNFDCRDSRSDVYAMRCIAGLGRKNNNILICEEEETINFIKNNWQSKSNWQTENEIVEACKKCYDNPNCTLGRS